MAGSNPEWANCKGLWFQLSFFTVKRGKLVKTNCRTWGKIVYYREVLYINSLYYK